MTAAKNYTHSAILVNYNHAPFLPAAIAGLQAQTIPFDEIVVMDDASTDNSVALLEGLLKSLPQARLIKHAANQGWWT